MPTPNVMSWDEAAKRFFEMGVSKGVIYTKTSDSSTTFDKAEPWNGLINVTESPSGADATKLWADGIEYANMRAAEEYGGSIEAYTYPDSFAECDGSAQLADGLTIYQQERKPFCLCWRSEIQNAEGLKAYKLHIAYNLTVSPSERSYDTVNDSPDAKTMSWDFEGTPVTVTGMKPTCAIELDSRNVPSGKMELIEKKLYGDATATTGGDATCLTPDQIKAIINGSPST